MVVFLTYQVVVELATDYVHESTWIWLMGKSYVFDYVNSLLLQCSLLLHWEYVSVLNLENSPHQQLTGELIGENISPVRVGEL